MGQGPLPPQRVTLDYVAGTVPRLVSARNRCVYFWAGDAGAFAERRGGQNRDIHVAVTYPQWAIRQGIGSISRDARTATLAPRGGGAGAFPNDYGCLHRDIPVTLHTRSAPPGGGCGYGTRLYPRDARPRAYSKNHAKLPGACTHAHMQDLAHIAAKGPETAPVAPAPSDGHDPGRGHRASLRRARPLTVDIFRILNMADFPQNPVTGHKGAKTAL